MQYGFYRYALLADLTWFASETALTKNSRKARTCLFGATLWQIIKVLWLVKYLSLFLLTGEAGIVNVQGCGMHWYLSWLASQTMCIDTESGTISRHFEILQKFWERSAIWFTYIDELKIKYFFKFYISQTLIFTGFFDFNSLIECLKVNRVYVTSFSFHSRLVLEKQKKPASHELAIYAVFF